MEFVTENAVLDRNVGLILHQWRGQCLRNMDFEEQETILYLERLDHRASPDHGLSKG